MDSKFRDLVNAQLKIKPLDSPIAYHLFVRDFGSECYTMEAYWEMIPEYIISRCPICLTPYQQVIDTYSLYLWDIRYNLESVSYSRYGYHRCEHFVGVHTFLNLNGERPDPGNLYGRSLFSSEPETPMISPHLLPDDIQSYAVLHSLPIADYFVPKYSLYMITYYSTDEKTLKLRRLLEWTAGKKLMSQFNVRWGYGYKRLAIYWEEAENKAEAWDLRYWVAKGKLLWLDLTQPELPLAHNRNEFPYEAMEGVRHGYDFKNGQYEIVSTKPTLQEYPEILKKYHPEVWNEDITPPDTHKNL